MSEKYIVDSDSLVPIDKARPSWWYEAYRQGFEDAWREYEERKAQKDAICNGDEVYFTMFGQNFKVIAIQRDLEGSWQVLNDRGGLIEINESDLTKTGRHVDLSVLFGGEK